MANIDNLSITSRIDHSRIMTNKEITAFSVYALMDPRTKEVRYVGCTFNSPKSRKKSHMYTQNKPYTDKERWIKDLKKEGLEPELVFLELQLAFKDSGSYPYELALDVERQWMRVMINNGNKLLNKTNLPKSPFERNKKYMRIIQKWQAIDPDKVLIVWRDDIGPRKLRRLFDRHLEPDTYSLRTRRDRDAPTAVIWPPPSENNFNMEITSPKEALARMGAGSIDCTSKHSYLLSALKKLPPSHSFCITGIDRRDSNDIRSYLYKKTSKSAFSITLAPRSRWSGNVSFFVITPSDFPETKQKEFLDKGAFQTPAHACYDARVLPTQVAEERINNTPPIPEDNLKNIGDIFKNLCEGEVQIVKKVSKKNIPQIRKYLRERFGNCSVNIKTVHRGHAKYRVIISSVQG